MHHEDSASAVAVDRWGNVYVTGGSRGFGDDYDFVTIKYSRKGGKLWERRYEGPHSDYNDKANAIAVDASGNVYVTGRSYAGPGSDQSDYLTIKYDAEGILQWYAVYNGPANGNDEAHAIAVDGWGNVYVTGESWGGSDAIYDIVTIKYNSTGVQQWEKRYNGPGNNTDKAYAIGIDNSGFVYVAGESRGSNYYSDCIVIKYNPANGDPLWVSRYRENNDANEFGYALKVDGSGNTYVAGMAWGGGATNFDYLTVKYNSSGVLQWAQHFNGIGNDRDEARAIAVDGSGNVYVTGRSDWVSDIDQTDYEYLTIKYNSSGVLQWRQTYNNNSIPLGKDEASAIAVDRYGYISVTGRSQNSQDNYDYVTIKYKSANGAEFWNRRYDATNGDDIAADLVVDDWGDVIVTGTSDGGGRNFDYLTIKYTDAIQPNSGGEATKIEILSSTIDTKTIISSTSSGYSFKAPADVSGLRIYNVQGKLICSEKPNNGYFTVKGVPAGIYFLRFESEYSEADRKFIIVK